MGRPEKSLDELHPAFREKVEQLLTNLEARRAKPLVWETVRSPERAELLRKQGKSKSGNRSMHCHRAAVDIIHRKDFWGNRAFFRVLGEEAEKLGLLWGGNWDEDPDTRDRFYDGPHVQAIPLRLQNEFRALPTEEQNDYLKAYFAKEKSDEPIKVAAAAPKPKTKRKRKPVPKPPGDGDEEGEA